MFLCSDHLTWIHLHQYNPKRSRYAFLYCPNDEFCKLKKNFCLLMRLGCVWSVRLCSSISSSLVSVWRRRQQPQQTNCCHGDKRVGGDDAQTQSFKCFQRVSPTPDELHRQHCCQRPDCRNAVKTPTEELLSAERPPAGCGANKLSALCPLLGHVLTHQGCTTQGLAGQ